MRSRWGSIVATAVLVIAVVALYLRGVLFGRGAIAIALQVLAVALMVWARVTFGRRSFHFAANPTAGGLVTHGPYRWWRHPIYAAVLLFVWTGVLSNHPGPVVLALAVVATVATAVRMGAEEAHLRGAFPEYDAYAARTRRIIPFVL